MNIAVPMRLTTKHDMEETTKKRYKRQKEREDEHRENIDILVLTAFARSVKRGS